MENAVPLKPIAAAVVLSALTACSGNATPVNSAPPPAGESTGQQPTASGYATVVSDQVTLDRLLNNKGITLQWITWDQRGSVHTRWDGDVLRMRGSQSAADGRGKVEIDGHVSEVGKDYFTFKGKITITDTPDPGRRCEMDKTWHFAITQNRPYYRLREFEWCDYLTDYVDIYF